jgi:hypothetical protein
MRRSARCETPSTFSINTGDASLHSQSRKHALSEGWKLVALHVRTTHVHAIVQGAATPERMLNDFKSYASRRLSSQLDESREIRRWTRHGSTCYLWDAQSVETAVRYVLEEQGSEMQAVDGSQEVDA